MTQLDTVARMLRRHPEGVCSVRFLNAHIPRAAARVHDLRQKGWIIDTTPCVDPYHAHRTRQVRYTVQVAATSHGRTS